ncbi:MAG TPA: hypothetical protein VK644_14765, partial [Chitinophagaceae bacterium]|nr:hypothetical protein [Chitinophagaceae bacterium]
HEVSDVVSPPREYTNAHVHHDCNEINLIISPGKLIYRVELNGEARQAESNSSIWIPRGTVHSANVLQGSGYFITIRIA